jgi:toxin secretion/phage lysis holin
MLFCTAVSWVLGGFDLLFRALLTLMVLDYLSGILVAIKRKKLSSSIGFKGLSKKIMIFIIVAVSNRIDIIIMSGGNIFRTLTIAFYSANEAISVLENATDLGLPLPHRIMSVLEQITKNK